MKYFPLRPLLILFLCPILFLVLLKHSFVYSPFSARATSWPTVGEIQPISTNNRSHIERQSAANDFSPNIIARQTYSLTLKATVGLDPHQCAEQPIINVPPQTLVVVCYFVTNVGRESIELHSVEDKHRGLIVTQQPFSLAPGVSALITSTRIVTETIVHMGTWHGLDATGTVLASASASAKSYVDGLLVEPGVRQPNGECLWTRDLLLPPDSSLTFCYRLSNESDLSITQHRLIAGKTGRTLASLAKTLEPGEQMTLQEVGPTLTDLITTTSDHSLIWRATATTAPLDLAKENFDDPVPLSAVGTLNARVPELTGRLTVGLERDTCAGTAELSVFAGTEVILCYSVTNVGGVTLTHHTITDNFVPAEQPMSAPQSGDGQPVQRIVRKGEAFQMSPGIAGQFTEAQIVDKSAVVTMTWTAFSTDPAGGTVTQTPAPTTLTFPLPYVSAIATSQVSITVMPLASIDLTLYEDSNQNGKQDDGEPSIPNATVDLTTTNDGPFTATTDSAGIARFTGLLPAVYEIHVDFERTPFFFEPTTGNITNLLLRSGENDGVALGYMGVGRRPQKIYLPVQLQ